MAHASPSKCALLSISRDLAKQVSRLSFDAPVTHVYNPLEYAREPHELYLERFGSGKKKVIFVGMNPGPFGMAQTGVPFGDVTMVRDFLHIVGKVTRPKNEHPKRPIDGFDCTRSEISGTRLWGYFREQFGTAQAFAKTAFVVNYCPLVFMEASSKNRTPEKLPIAERDPLFAACDDALRATVVALAPEWVIGVGAFAEARARAALSGLPVQITTVLHPSPASPRANRGWAREATIDLEKAGIRLSK